ncbi:MAG: 4Fe-4S dicluster domain-containing protein [Gammaproteobacteria bacterium]|nr:4Fe-4S dicluster domain-containing protein [Gammaproteobacteria bacterium]
MEAGFLPRARFQVLLDALHQAGYRCVGPQARDGAIIYDTLGKAGELPQGIRDAQAPGRYRLEKTESPRYFSWANGPQALKPFLFAPHEPMWRCERNARGEIHFSEIKPAAELLAVIGVRACDLAALRLQDRHFLQGAFVDPYYAARRENIFLVAVHCTHPADTCFCASTGDGPDATQGFDLALNELDDGYLVQSGSDKGGVIAARLPLMPATNIHRQTASRETQEAAQRQTRRLPSRNLRDALFANLEHPRWENVAERCLSCGNCTSVCPTCFCHSESDETVLDGHHSLHARQWDSCFTQGHSYIHGMTIRADTRTRYRQWLTHKLGSWHDQYGRSGCVGCGRCITWCPVGIDITEEIAAISSAEFGVRNAE